MEYQVDLRGPQLVMVLAAGVTFAAFLLQMAKSSGTRLVYVAAHPNAIARRLTRKH